MWLKHVLRLACTQSPVIFTAGFSNGDHLGYVEGVAKYTLVCFERRHRRSGRFRSSKFPAPEFRIAIPVRGIPGEGLWHSHLMIL